MEIEFRRHNWSALPTPYSNGDALVRSLRELASAVDRAVAESACRSVRNIIDPTNEVATPASVATSAVLVSALFDAAPVAIERIVGLLSDISAGYAERETGPSVNFRRVMDEIKLGFGRYVNLLETDPDLDVRTACIDLIFACGYWDDWFTSRAEHVLSSARELEGLQEKVELIDSSLAELRNR